MALPRRTPAYTYSGTALITGASAGLGVAYAEELARKGMDLILVARSAGPMEDLATRLRAETGRTMTVLPADLTDRQARARLVSDIEERGLVVDMVVNNAGFGTKGDFAELDPDRIVREIELNCVALADLARQFLPGMLERHHGAIINIASTAGFQPWPTMSVYGATKAFVRSLSLAMWSETRGTGVRVLSVCPGATDTDWMAKTGAPDMLPNRRSPKQVVASTFRALDRDQPEVVDGVVNWITGHVATIAPTRVKLPIARLYAKE